MSLLPIIGVSIGCTLSDSLCECVLIIVGVGGSPSGTGGHGDGRGVVVGEVDGDSDGGGPKLRHCQGPSCQQPTQTCSKTCYKDTS